MRQDGPGAACSPHFSRPCRQYLPNSAMTARGHDDLLHMYATYLKERGYKSANVPETVTRTPDLEVRPVGDVGRLT